MKPYGLKAQKRFLWEDVEISKGRERSSANSKIRKEVLDFDENVDIISDMKTNVKNTPKPVRTHEGAVAKRITPVQELRRSVMACMLWENSFYESGKTIADRIEELVIYT
jgi:hypothetical protein